MKPEILPQLADKLRQLREFKTELENKVKQLNEEIGQAERYLIGLMLDTEMKNFTKSGTQFTLVTKVRASATAGRKDDLFAALKTHGYGSLVTETVNANSLSSFAKEQMEENGDVLPEWLDGLINTFEQTQIQLRKAT